MGDGGRSGQECPLSITDQLQPPSPLAVIGCDGEALAIEFRAPLLAGIAGSKGAVFLTMNGVASGFIGGADAGPIRGGETFRRSFWCGRVRSEGDAGKTGEEDDDRFHLLERLGSGKKPR